MPVPNLFTPILTGQASPTLAGASCSCVARSQYEVVVVLGDEAGTRPIRCGGGGGGDTAGTRRGRCSLCQ